MLNGMSENTGEFVLGADWRLASWYGRGVTIEQMSQRKKDMAPIAFAMNYESKWVGASENQIVDVNKLLSSRNLTDPEFEAVEGAEYYFGVDVARSQKSTNNKTVITVIRAERNDNNTIKELKLVNLIVISNSQSFTSQAIELKVAYKRYKPKIVILDTNGLGVGLKDELLKNQKNPYDGDILEAWDTVNTDDESENVGAPEILYALYPQQAQTEITVNFMDVVGSGKLRLLEAIDDSEINIFSKDDVLKYAPFKQTDELVGEILNIKTKQNNNGSITIERVVSNIDKDRYTSLAYILWWIMKFDNTPINEDKTISSYFNRMNNSRIAGYNHKNPKKFIGSIFR